MRAVPPRVRVRCTAATRLLTLSLLFIARQASAAPAKAEVSNLAHRVDDHYNHLRSLRCTFAERYIGLGRERNETGTLLLQKPGRMRWNYTEPAGKVFVLDGKYAWSYTPGDAQVQRLQAKQLDDLRSPLRFLLGRTRLEQELSGLTVADRGNSFHLSGQPKGMEQRVASLALDVLPDGTIQAIRVEERDGSMTEFRFSDVTENAAIADAEMEFHVPDGLAVVDGLPPI